MNAFDTLALQATEAADSYELTVEDAAEGAVSGADAATQAAAAVALLTGEYTPEGDLLAQALRDALELRLARDARAAALEADEDTAAHYRAWAAGTRTSGPAGFIGYGNGARPHPRLDPWGGHSRDVN